MDLEQSIMRMMSSRLITLTVVAVIGLVGFGAIVLKNNDKSTSTKTDTATTSTNNNQNTAQSSSDAQTNMITYKGFAVVQKAIKVKKGTTVTWTNQDSAKHDVTPANETEEFKASGLFGKGETYSVTFNTVGTYSYYCSPHPYMKGSVEVIE